MTKKHSPNRIAALRHEFGVTQEELAERMGTIKTQIFKLEHGERRLTHDWMKRIAKALGNGVQWWEIPEDGETLQPDQRQLLVGYRKLNDGAKRMILSMIEAYQHMPNEELERALPLAAEETPDRDRPARRMGAKRSKYRAA